MDYLLDNDTALFLYLNGLGTESWDSFWLLITNKLTWIPLYAIFLFFVYRIEKSVWKMLLIAALLGVLVGINDGLSNFSKHYFERPRPCQVDAILQSPLFRMVAPYCSKYGYFSAHAANHFAIATFFAFYFGKEWRVAPLFLFVWAAVIAYSRIYVGVHYPLDILTGTFVGIVTATFIYKCFYGFLSDRLFSKR